MNRVRITGKSFKTAYTLLREGRFGEIHVRLWRKWHLISIGKYSSEVEQYHYKRGALWRSPLKKSLLIPDPGVRTMSIIVCVHNAIDDVMRCLAALPAALSNLDEIIIVNDGSNETTTGILREAAAALKAKYIHHETARGYTKAANAGIALAVGDLTILLNSDTIPASGAFKGMIEAARSDVRIGFVGAMSNTASWQSIPQVFDADGDWAANKVEGAEIATIGRDLQRLQPHPIPLPFVNGFCFGIKRSLLAKIGGFDDHFDHFGEENDFCLRARKAGFTGSVAAASFVYHAQSKSYSAKRAHYTKIADERLVHRHGTDAVAAGAMRCRDDLSLAWLRSWRTYSARRTAIIRAAQAAFGGLTVAAYLPARDGGGVNIIVSELSAMRYFGVRPIIINHRPMGQRFIDYTGWPKEDLVLIDDPSGLAEAIRTHEALRLCRAFVGTSFATPQVLAEALAGRDSVRGYYVQDYEPNFYASASAECKMAKDSYSIPGQLLFCKTGWNAAMVLRETGAKVIPLGLSVEATRFPPTIRAPDAAMVVAAMIRPTTQRRAPRETYMVMEALSAAFPQVNFVTFGCTLDELAAQDYFKGARANWRHLGALDRGGMSRLLGEVDVFLDLSVYQAMGLTALEAMASGAIVIGSPNGAMPEFIKPRETGFLVSSLDQAQAEVPRILREILGDADLRTRIRHAAIGVAFGALPEECAFKMLSLLFPRESSRKTS